jgi:hypothetical protein
MPTAHRTSLCPTPRQIWPTNAPPSDAFVIADSPDTTLIFSVYLLLLPGAFNWKRLGTVVSRIHIG